MQGKVMFSIEFNGIWFYFTELKVITLFAFNNNSKEKIAGCELFYS